MQQWTFTRIIIAIIVVAACVGILWVILPVLGVTLPAWFITIVWIVAAAAVAIIAIKFLSTLW